MRKSISNGLSFVLSNFINALIPFILLPILVSVLSASDYGQLAIFQLIQYGLFGIIGLSGYIVSNRKFFDDACKDDKEKLIYSSFFIAIINSFIIFIVFFFVGENASKYIGLETSFVYYAICTGFSLNIIQIFLGQLQVRGDGRAYLFFFLFKFAFELIVSCMAIYIYGTLESRIYSIVITNILFAILAFVLLLKYGYITTKNATPEMNSMHELFRSGLLLLPNFIGLAFMSSIDRIIIADKIGVTSVGIYMVAMQFSNALLMLFDAMNKVYYPILSRNLISENLTRFKDTVKSAYLLIAMMIFTGIVSCLIVPYILSWFVTPEYNGAKELVLWLIIGQTISGVTLILSNYFLHHKDNGTLSIVTVFSGIIHISLSYILIQYYGLFGIAISFIASKLFQMILSVLLITLRYDVPWFLSFSRKK